MMNVLFLGNRESPVLDWLRTQHTNCRDTTGPITEADCAWASHLVSHGYRHIVRPAVLRLFPRRAVNIHISYLPWNRGADPNFWSWLNDTPKGATIHLLDEGVDTGPIIAQRAIVMDADVETLCTSYVKLQSLALALFVDVWPCIADGTFYATPQTGPATSHRMADMSAFVSMLWREWDTPCSVLSDYAAEVQMSAAARDMELEDIIANSRIES